MSIKRFDGSAWVDAQAIKRFDGTSWVDVQSAKRWDGANWIDTWLPLAFRPDHNSSYVGTQGHLNIAAGVMDAKLLGTTTGPHLRAAIVTNMTTVPSGSTLTIDCEYSEGTLGAAATMYVVRDDGSGTIIKSFPSSFARQVQSVPMPAGQYGIVISAEHNTKNASQPVIMKIYNVKLSGVDIPIIST